MLKFSKKKAYAAIIAIEMAVILLALCSFNSVSTTSKAYTLQSQNNPDTFSAYSNVVSITTGSNGGGGGGPCTGDCCGVPCIKANPIDYGTFLKSSQTTNSNLANTHISNLAIDKATGDIYFLLETDNGLAIAKKTISGVFTMVTKLSKEVATLKPFSSVAVSNNNIYLASSKSQIIKISASGQIDINFAGGGSLNPSIGKSAKDCQLGKLNALDTDSLGNLYIATETILREGNYYKLSPNGQIIYNYQDAHSGFRISEATGLCIDSSTHEVLAPNGQVLIAQDPSSNTKLGKLIGLAVDSSTNDIYLCDATDYTIKKVGSTGSISIVLGGGNETEKKTDVLATSIKLTHAPSSISIGDDGTIYVATTGNPGTIYQINNGIAKLIAGSGLSYLTKESKEVSLGKLQSMICDLNGNLYVIDKTSSNLLKFQTQENRSTSLPNKLSQSKTQAQQYLAPQISLKAGNSNQPMNVSMPSPTAPSNLRANLSGCCTINLAWINNAQGQLGFVIERSTNNGNTFSALAEVPANQTQFTDSGNTQTTYFYRVRLKGSISSVTFERPVGVSFPIEDNHNPTDGKIIGKRIFPDKDSPNGQPNNKVLVIAKTTFPIGTMINFKSFDIDDPSTDDPIIDPNGKMGMDNRGTMANGGIPQEGMLDKVAVPVTACSDGRTDNCAEVEFTTTMFAGDNFKVVASVDDDYLTSLILAGDGLTITEPNAPLDNTKANASPELTVWRRLHIELDFMGKVNGNQQSAKIQNITRTPNSAVVVVDKVLDLNQYENGSLIIDKRQFSIMTNSGKAGNEIQIRGLLPTDIKVGQQVLLVDDDDFNSNDRAPRGDEGETITAIPGLLDLMKESDSPLDNVYANAFIIPIFDGGGSLSNNTPDVKFQVNVNDTDEDVAKQINQGIQTSVLELNGKGQLTDVHFSGTDDYWIAYVQIAYQGDKTKDDDPDKEKGVEGVSITFELSDNPILKPSDHVPFGGFASLIFIEVSRENKDFTEVKGLSTVIPHEIGHQFGLQGDTSTADIMGNDASTRKFLPNHLSIIRARMHTLGQFK